jgi:hypothetical protein
MMQGDWGCRCADARRNPAMLAFTLTLLGSILSLAQMISALGTLAV